MRKIVVFVSASVPVLFRGKKICFSLCEILKLLRLIRRFEQYMKGFECYCDADFSGNWNKAFAPVDPSTAKSRSGWIIFYAGRLEEINRRNCTIWIFLALIFLLEIIAMVKVKDCVNKYNYEIIWICFIFTYFFEDFQIILLHF